MFSPVVAMPGKRVEVASNPAVLPVPVTSRNFAFTPAQLSGNFRLTTLTPSEINCVSGAEAGRASLGLATMVPDEFLTEGATVTTQEGVPQDTDMPVPVFGSGSIATLGGFAANVTESIAQVVSVCADWTNTGSFTQGNVQYPLAINPAAIYYGADSEGTGISQVNVLPIRTRPARRSSIARACHFRDLGRDDFAMWCIGLQKRWARGVAPGAR